DDRLGQQFGDGGRDLLALVPHDGDDVRRREFPRGREHVPEERHPRELVQHLRTRGLHAGALTGGEDDDGETRIGHPPILAGAPCARSWRLGRTEGTLNRRDYGAGMSIDIPTTADLTELTRHRHAASVS